jgi:ribonuclease Z
MDRFGPSILVEAGPHKLLLDCGRGATQRLFERDLLTKVDGVFFTHLHSDHVTGFPDLWLSGWLFGRDRPLRVWGPRGTPAMIRNLERAYAFDVHMRRADEGLSAAGVRIDFHEIAEGEVQTGMEGLRVTAFLVDHGPVKPALGYRVDYRGHAAVFSGDTRPSENLVNHSQGIDVLIHEVLAPEVERRRARMVDPAAIERVIAHHTTAEEAGKLFARIRPRLAVFSHIVPSVATESDVLPDARKHYDGRMVFGVDRMAISIGREIEVTYP